MQGGKYNRHSIRLKGYDYSRVGMYFVTICVKDRECLFGEIRNEEMHLNKLGKIVERGWLKTAEIRKNVELDEFIIMPNHLHGIIFICRGVLQYAPTVGLHSPSQTLGAIVRGFKSSVTNCINKFRNTQSAPVWQRNYYEHIIRNEQSLDKIRNYVYSNPGGWLNDIENSTMNKKTIESQRKNYYQNIY